MNPHPWQFFTTAPSIWDGMLADIRNARKSIDIEQYGFYDDQVGRRFLEIFEEKLKQGVAVRMICDATGSWPLFFSSYVKHLRSLGLEIQSSTNPSSQTVVLPDTPEIVGDRFANRLVGGIGHEGKD